MKKMIYVLVFINALLLTGCADAGKDQNVVSSDVVTLDGSASTVDYFGKIKKYRWKQVQGQKVSISDVKAIKPTFTAPSVSQKTTLVFRLVTKEIGGYISPWKTKDEVTIMVNPPSAENKLPHAMITTSSETIKYGESVIFDASDSNDSDGEIVSYEWTDAEGGILGSGVTLSHVFDTIGTHTVTLTVTDTEGATATASITVTVNALQKPHADINASATIVPVNDTVIFDANGSTDGDGEIISYTWTDTQGNVLSDMKSFTYTFAVSGEHNITLNVMDDDELVDIDTVTITVEALLLSVSLSSGVSSLEVNEITALYATAYYNDNTTIIVSNSVEWVVGDTNVLSIDANGTLKALQEGTTNVMAKVGDAESNVINIEVIPLDTTHPILRLNGEVNLTLTQGTEYTELGASANDDRDGDVNVTITGTVDNTIGTYTVTYTARDSAGNEANITRVITVIDVTPPVITLNGNVDIVLTKGDVYEELGALAIDNSDGNVTVEISGNVDTSIEGSYTVTYMATDNSGNTVTVTRTVTIEKRIESPHIVISDELSSALSENTIPYNRITLDIPATSTQTLIAINTTLSQEQNRTIRVKGVDNNGTFYLYNMPLMKGLNEMELRASNEVGDEVMQTLTINADANLSIPIKIRASEFEGVQSLQTIVTIDTLLKTKKYLFDSNGDGVIDESQLSDDNNFTVNLTKEGRYRPRVTIRTEDNLLYSSGDHTISLDVKANEAQKDPTGAAPIDVAKEFVDALINDDRETVEELLGHNENLVYIIYGKPGGTAYFKKIYSSISSWEQTYHLIGDASISISYEDNGTTHHGGFELMLHHSHALYTGRQWSISMLY